MDRHFICTALLVIFIALPIQLKAQISDDIGGDRLIRVAELGQLTDSINVWGNVGSSGRYVVPEDTKLPELISYSMGYTQQRTGGREGDFSKTRIEVKVSRFKENRGMVEVAFFRYQYHEPEPAKMFTFDLQNNDIVTLQVKSKPTFGDYVGTIAPVISVLATSILLIENLRGN